MTKESENCGIFYFVGAGLGDENDLTIKGFNAIKGSKTVFMEQYTSVLMGLDVKKLEKLIKNKVNILLRKDLENCYERIYKSVLEGDTSFITAGDPFIATTHHDLLLWLKKRNVTVKVINNVSIINAVISITGLHAYKFGKIASIPFPYKNVLPFSSLNVIEDNLSINAHTIVLLDIDTENNRYMKANEAISIILEMAEKAEKKGTLNDKSLGIVVCRAGSDKLTVSSGMLSELKKINFGDPLHTIIIPSRLLHFTEEEAISLYAINGK